MHIIMPKVIPVNHINIATRLEQVHGIKNLNVQRHFIYSIYRHINFIEKTIPLEEQLLFPEIPSKVKNAFFQPHDGKVIPRRQSWYILTEKGLSVMKDLIANLD